jgi:hypothetical protein
VIRIGECRSSTSPLVDHLPAMQSQAGTATIARKPIDSFTRNGMRIGIIKFTCGGNLGSFTNTVSLASSDLDESPYTFTVAFTVTVMPPALTVTRQGSNILLAWPTNTIGFTLQSLTDLTRTNWTVNSVPASIVSGHYVATNGITNNAQFFRLKKP